MYVVDLKIIHDDICKNLMKNENIPFSISSSFHHDFMLNNANITFFYRYNIIL